MVVLQAIVVDEDRVSKLLDILRKKDDLLFPRFCDALVATGQQHVVDCLLTETSSNSLPGMSNQMSNAGTAVASPPPTGIGDPALCGSQPLVTLVSLCRFRD